MKEPQCYVNTYIACLVYLRYRAASINYLLKQRREGQNVPASHTVPILSTYFTVFVYMQIYISQERNLLSRQTALLKDTTFSTYGQNKAVLKQ